MDSSDFLNKLFREFGDAEITNMGFKRNDDYFLKALYDFKKDKKIFALSLSFFNELIFEITLTQFSKYLDAIISLPVFEDGDNLILLIFNKSKRDNGCLFIDESDSLLHKSDNVDWTYAGSELIKRITKSYADFRESDTAVILNIDDIFDKDLVLNQYDSMKTQKEPSLENISHNKYSILKELTFEEEEINSSKRRVLSEEITDLMPSVNMKSQSMPQKNNLSFLNDMMYSKKRQNPENLLYKDNHPLIDGEVDFKKLGDVASLQNTYKKIYNNSILIATSKSSIPKLVFYTEEITDFEGELCIEISDISENVLKEYLYEYLSSDNGLDEILFFSRRNTHITPEDIENIKIPVPSLDVQKEIINVARESREFFKSVKLLMKNFNSNILDYKHMKNSLRELKGDIAFDLDTNEITKLPRSWRHAYKGLIWPLAISYLSATKGGFEIVEKKDNYLVLFEFIAAFNSIVMLSALPDDVYQSDFQRIWDAKNIGEYKMMSFSNWVYVSRNISNIYKYNNFTSKLGGDLFDKITHDKLLTILEKARNMRNEEFHGSHSNAYEAEKIVEKLDVYLDEIFDILEVYSDYKLFYTTGTVVSKNKAFNHRVILLNGPCAQPIYGSMIFDSVLESESLYLYNPKNNQKVKLLDNFIKFLPIDRNKKRWALFVYYSCDKKEKYAFYKCFQSKENDVKVNISSFKGDILGKSSKS